jgi:hypothetical protein
VADGGRLGLVIDRFTGALVLPSGTIGRDLTRSAFLASPLGAKAVCDDMHTGWMHIYPGAQTLDGLVFGVDLVFDGERLDCYSLWLDDARYGTSWDDWSEEKQLAQRDAHDAWLVSNLGPGERQPSPRGPELRYSFAWGEAWSTYDARGGSSTIGVRFRREVLLPV